VERPYCQLRKKQKNKKKKKEKGRRLNCQSIQEAKKAKAAGK
jgi:predicted ABC-class ATPase